MEKWLLYAFLSMFFAGFTSVAAKAGLNGISSELGLAVRTLFVCVFVILFSMFHVSVQDVKGVALTNLAGLGFSAAATALSWVFFYKALKIGDVATVSLIDKGSIIIAIILAWLLLKEPITPRIIAGLMLVLSGLIVISYK